MSDPLAAEIVAFWTAAGPPKWFAKDAAFDDEIASRFGHLVEPAAAGELDHWMETAEGALALILVLDQFRRNLYRDDARAFSADDKAAALADQAVERRYDQAFESPLKRFIYMPYMHAEDMALQQKLIDLCRAVGDEDGVKWGEVHADIIRRFGRFPHRNKVLGRATTDDEQAFLDEGGFAG
jgi:uncharacterized protein (DUF924 family)